MVMAKKMHDPVSRAAQAKLIADLGGPTAVARMLNGRLNLNLGQQAVSNWKARRIPFEYRAALAIEARERNVGLPLGWLGEVPAPAGDQVPFL